MSQIGTVLRGTDGSYQGHLKTLSIKAPIRIVPVTDKPNERYPDFRVLSDGVEVGAGWNRVGKESGNEYVSLSFAAPEFGPRKLYANLGRAADQDDDDVFAIIWSPND